VKRVFWMLVGLGAGAAIGVQTVRWASRTAEQLAPQSVAKRALGAAGEWRERLTAAYEEGHAAMTEREAELRAQLAEPGNETS